MKTINLKTILMRLQAKSFLPIIALLVIFLGCCYGLSNYTLANNNEGLYAEIAREMLVLHDFVIPHLNFVAYLEKPPLLYWLLALNYHLFGINTLAARLTPCVSAITVCLSLIYFSKRIQQVRAGYFAAILLASSFGFVLLARIVFFDMLLTCLITLALLSFYIWFEDGNKAFLRAAYAFLAAAILTKGLISFICLPIVLATILIARPEQKIKLLREFFDITGITLFLLLVIPWHLVALLQDPHFFWEYIVNQQFLRFFGHCEPNDYYSGPIYYYLPRLFIYFFPWSFLLFSLANKRKILLAKSLPIFLWIWFLVPLMVFSLSQAKANYYMLVGMPPLALLLGLRLHEMEVNKCYWFIFFAFISALTILLVSLGVGYNYAHAEIAQLSQLLTLLLISCLVSFILSIFIVAFTKFKTLCLFLLIAAFSLFSISILVKASSQLQAYFSSAAIADYIHQHDNQRSIYLYKDYENLSSIPFYLQRRISVINSVSSDLAYGAKDMAVQLWFISKNQFLQHSQQQAVYLIVAKERFTDLRNTLATVTLCELLVDRKAILLTNVGSECKTTKS